MAPAETPGLTSLDQERALSMADEGGAAAAAVEEARAPASEDGLARRRLALPAILASELLLGFVLCPVWRSRH